MSAAGHTPHRLAGVLDPAALHHRTIGARFVASAMCFFLLAGIAGLALRAQLALPESDVLGPARYQAVFALHGSLMLYFFIVPALLGAAIWLLPPMLGARELRLPRLAAFGSWCHLLGGLVLLGAAFWDGAPRGVQPTGMAPAWLAATSLAAIAGLAAAMALAAAILRGRGEGMRLADMPLLGWYLLGMAALLLVGLPSLLLACLLLWLEQGWGWAVFDAARGGDPLLWRRLVSPFGWLQAAIVLLPAMGLLATWLPAHARHAMVMPRWLAAVPLVVLALAAASWLHNLVPFDVSPAAAGGFGVATALPAAVFVAAMIATIGAGRPMLGPPLLLAAGFVAILVLGGLAAVMLAAPPRAEGTQAMVAVLHLVLWGGAVFPLLGALHHWWPEVTGRRPGEHSGRIGAGLMLAGVLLTFLPLLALGLDGMPRRVHTYPEGLGWATPNLAASGGAVVLACGIAVLLGGLLVAAWRGTPVTLAAAAASEARARSWLPLATALCVTALVLGLAAGSGPAAAAGAASTALAAMVWNWPGLQRSVPRARARAALGLVLAAGATAVALSAIPSLTGVP